MKNIGVLHHMSLFKLKGIKRDKKRNTASAEKSDENGYICSGCGRFNPKSYKFCPNCGMKLLSEFNSANTEMQNYKIDDFCQEDETTVYLRKMNLLHLAGKQYLINVRLEDRNIVTIPLTGRQNSNDALQYLQNKGFLSKNKRYQFTNWPQANPCIGPWYQHASACVCELSSDIIYSVNHLEMEDIRMLYGCPNAKSIVQSTILDQVHVEVIDYER